MSPDVRYMSVSYDDMANLECSLRVLGCGCMSAISYVLCVSGLYWFDVDICVYIVSDRMAGPP